MKNNPTLQESGSLPSRNTSKSAPLAAAIALTLSGSAAHAMDVCDDTKLMEECTLPVSDPTATHRAFSVNNSAQAVSVSSDVLTVYTDVNDSGAAVVEISPSDILAACDADRFRTFSDVNILANGDIIIKESRYIGNLVITPDTPGDWTSGIGSCDTSAYSEYSLYPSYASDGTVVATSYASESGGVVEGGIYESDETTVILDDATKVEVNPSSDGDYMVFEQFSTSSDGSIRELHVLDQVSGDVTSTGLTGTTPSAVDGSVYFVDANNDLVRAPYLPTEAVPGGTSAFAPEGATSLAQLTLSPFADHVVVDTDAAKITLASTEDADAALAEDAETDELATLREWAGSFTVEGPGGETIVLTATADSTTAVGFEVFGITDAMAPPSSLGEGESWSLSVKNNGSIANQYDLSGVPCPPDVAVGDIEPGNSIVVDALCNIEDGGDDGSGDTGGDDGGSDTGGDNGDGSGDDGGEGAGGDDGTDTPEVVDETETTEGAGGNGGAGCSTAEGSAISGLATGAAALGLAAVARRRDDETEA